MLDHKTLQGGFKSWRTVTGATVRKDRGLTGVSVDDRRGGLATGGGGLATGME